jgi:hypothetical protein
VTVGLVRVGAVPKTTAPLPVDEVTPVPPLATGRVPDTLVAKAQYVVDVEPVPPLAMLRVPAKVIAPVVVVLGVKPVVPALNEDTVDVADHVGTPPATVRTVPVAPIPSLDRVVPDE